MSGMTQRAVQLTRPDELKYNDAKPVPQPGRHQMLCKVETVGLCFSDLKLLKQFDAHVRKTGVVSGIDPAILTEIPSYVPGEAPTVPGHETVVRIEKTGDDVQRFEVGRRYVVQPEYRWLKTAGSNAAFGYNFEGALQEYVLMDERAITDPTGRSMLVPVCDELAASAAALAEPWACVEHSYTSAERKTIKADANMLIVCDSVPPVPVLEGFLGRFGRPARITMVGKPLPVKELQIAIERAPTISQLPDSFFDDVLYFGSSAERLERIFAKVGSNGLLNIVCCKKKFGMDVTMPVGRVHYSEIRIIGTVGQDPAESMANIPATGQIRANERINIIGAAGPMGMMHVVRSVCQGVAGLSVYAGDIDERRLRMLERIAVPPARKNNVELVIYNTERRRPDVAFSYVVIMAPVPELVTEAVRMCTTGGIINIFTGIPTAVTARVDLDSYIEKRLYFVAASGSTLQDMKAVLTRIESGRLDTNKLVAAVCGLEAAIEAIKAVENRTIAGKIMVYPPCKGLPLVRLEQMGQDMPEVAACLDEGLWTKEAEQMLLKKYGN